MQNFKKILIPVDIHTESDAVTLVKAAVDFADKFDSDLTFVNVIDIDLDSAMIDRFDDVQGQYARSARTQLNDLVKKYLPDGREAKILVLNGRSYSKVVEAAEDLGSDLIMLSAHKPGMKEFLLGMTAARVVRHANCSVLVVRDGE